MDTTIPDRHICPRCGGGVPNSMHPGKFPGALSRWDNRTELCSDCGTDEAMAQFFAAQQGRHPMEAVHPVRGCRRWQRVPKEASND
jgi:ribosomal protein S27AE